MSTRSRSDFVYGSDDIMAGITQVRALLGRDDKGRAKLRLVKGRVGHLESEFLQYKMRLRDGEIADEPINQNSHLQDTLRYCAAYRPKYFKPNKASARASGAYLAFVKDREHQKQSLAGFAQQSKAVHLGPGRAV